VEIAVQSFEKNGVHCHCTVCRKISGAAFSSVLLVRRGALEIVRGREVLAAYRSSHNTDRWHCSRCHAPIYADVFDNDSLPLFVPAGLFDRGALDVCFEHMFVESRAPWHTIVDAAPQHAGDPPRELLTPKS
jgi:hypothetical protein